MRIIAFMAHPHYAAINCAGTIYHHTLRGDEVSLVTFTSGELLTNELPEDEVATINIKELQEAANVLGVKEVRNLGFKDSYISDNNETRLAVNNVIREYKPDVVLTHWPKSTHSDLEAASRSTIQGCMSSLINAGKWAEKYPTHWVGNLYGYEVPELTLGFEPTTFVDISDCMDKKIEAAKCFKMHFERVQGRNIEKWISANCTGPSRYWGLKANVMYAEPFAQIKIHEVHLKPVYYLT
ncbi:MAG: PIG-L deacetylase family protein [Candidatus Bathyarchaeia archaeon]